jgi:hypothetical protein
MTLNIDTLTSASRSTPGCHANRLSSIASRYCTKCHGKSTSAASFWAEIASDDSKKWSVNALMAFRSRRATRFMSATVSAPTVVDVKTRGWAGWRQPPETDGGEQADLICHVAVAERI